MLTKWLGWLAEYVMIDFWVQEVYINCVGWGVFPLDSINQDLAGQKHLHWCHVIEKSHLHSVDWVDPLEPNEEYKRLLENMVPHSIHFFFNHNFPKKQMAIWGNRFSDSETPKHHQNALQMTSNWPFGAITYFGYKSDYITVKWLVVHCCYCWIVPHFSVAQARRERRKAKAAEWTEDAPRTPLINWRYPAVECMFNKAKSQFNS